MALYENGEFSVTSTEFSGDSAAVVLHCLADGAFAKYEGDVTAYFSLGYDGNWDLDSVSPSNDIITADYSKLIGTWTGAFSKTENNWSKRCYGAQSQALSVTITSVDNSSLKIEGTFSGLAHYHKPSESDQNANDGDAYISGQSFVATLKDMYGTYSANCLVKATYTTPEATDGSTLTLSLEFGGSDDANAATGTLQTEYDYKDNYWTQTNRSADTYTLTKVE